MYIGAGDVATLMISAADFIFLRVLYFFLPMDLLIEDPACASEIIKLYGKQLKVSRERISELEKVSQSVLARWPMAIGGQEIG